MDDRQSEWVDELIDFEQSHPVPSVEEYRVLGRRLLRERLEKAGRGEGLYTLEDLAFVCRLEKKLISEYEQIMEAGAPLIVQARAGMVDWWMLDNATGYDTKWAKTLAKRGTAPTRLHRRAKASLKASEGLNPLIRLGLLQIEAMPFFAAVEAIDKLRPRLIWELIHAVREPAAAVGEATGHSASWAYTQAREWESLVVASMIHRDRDNRPWSREEIHAYLIHTAQMDRARTQAPS